jgi:GLPGLI family protein
MITYDFRYYRDTAKKEEFQDIKDLEIGNKIIRYHSAWAEKADSLGRISIRNSFTFRKDLGLNNHQKINWEDVYFNYPEKGTLFLSSLIVRYEYCYEESIPKMKWKTTRQTDTILGYKCYCATTDFKGRHYTAWFSPDIPYSYGPYKFNGLPGLILKVQDSQNFFTWTAERICTPHNKKIYLDQGKTVKKITYEKYSKILNLVWKDYVTLFKSQGGVLYGYNDTGRYEEKPGDEVYPPIPAIEIN